MKKELKDKMIADIMDGFDFAKVHDIMQSLNWEWKVGHDEMAVPAMWRIVDRAKELLEDVMKYYEDGQFHFISCGGFIASLNDEGDLSLQFILEEMTVYSDYYKEK